jgi:hypothetical protein
MSIPINRLVSGHTAEVINHGQRKLVASAAIGLVAASAAGVISPVAASAATGDEIRPFRANATDEELMDLGRRLRMTRWPDKETVDDRSQGHPAFKAQTAH